MGHGKSTHLGSQRFQFRSHGLRLRAHSFEFLVGIHMLVLGIQTLDLQNKKALFCVRVIQFSPMGIGVCSRDPNS